MAERLRLSGLDESDAKKLHLQLMTEEESAKLGLPRAGVGIKIPYYAADGELLKMFRYRFRETAVTTGFAKGAKLDKYAQPKDNTVEVYLPPLLDWPAIMEDPAQPVDHRGRAEIGRAHV